MSAAHVVVIGGGQAGFTACTALRTGGFAGEISLICDEEILPYERPPLSKAFLTTGAEIELRPDGFYASKDISLVPDEAVSLDTQRQSVTLRSGRALSYSDAILATGATPVQLDVPGADLHGVTVLRNHAQAAWLKKHLAQARQLVVIGAGFLGLEVAAAARSLDVAVTVVEALPRALARGVSAPVAQHLTALQRSRGTDFIFGRKVIGLEGDSGRWVKDVVLDDGTWLPADLVVVAIGVTPNTSLAASAGLALHNGIVVDSSLRTSAGNVYAIGDCASFPRGGSLIRLESVQNAIGHAECVASAISGNPSPYRAVPWFWSDQFETKLQIAGVPGPSTETALIGEGDKFSLCHFTNGQLTAVESINRPADHIIARRALAGDPKAIERIQTLTSPA